jgi:S-adenosylmethionine:tRNA ribosyltransferase-isomerase
MTPAQLFEATMRFTLPPHLEAREPAEVRGTGRDDVRLMVTHRDGRLANTHMRSLGDYLCEGDALVLNVSKTLAASLPVVGRELRLHVARRVSTSTFVVELRALTAAIGEDADATFPGTLPFLEAQAGQAFDLPAGGSARLIRPYRERDDGVRLWFAELKLPLPWLEYLETHGGPVRYAYAGDWPIEAYRTAYGHEPGSAEMPSAGRALTHEMLAQLSARGVEIIPVVLHTGLSSPEAWEGTQEEYYRVSAASARRINEVKAHGGRVIAVGTTVVRALETVADDDGRVHAGEGLTNKLIAPGVRLRAIDGLLTGWHEPQASHLLMLEAIMGRELLEESYRVALNEGYLWHEFGDAQLIV